MGSIFRIHFLPDNELCAPLHPTTTHVFMPLKWPLVDVFLTNLLNLGRSTQVRQGQRLYRSLVAAPPNTVYLAQEVVLVSFATSVNK